MAEEKKKLSKTAQAKEDTKNKNNFKKRCYEITMNCLTDCTSEMRMKNKIQIQLTNTNKYFTIRRYGESLNIAIFTSGDIDITVSEFCHGEYKERIFEYTTDVVAQEAFYKKYRKLLKGILPIGLGDGFADMHMLMDYISFGDNLEKAYDGLLDFHHGKKPK